MQLALNAANAGTTALENASESTMGVIADLETMIIFASAGTLENDSANESFAGNESNAKHFCYIFQYNIFVTYFDLIKFDIFWFQITKRRL